jgi:bifunctional DNA-binding transcriptional regulator/antitoxin component of YhaV-PrlF toxin-antitoxin module
MREQERKFPLVEVHTTIGAKGQIMVDQAFMELLGVQPGDWITFLINEQGVVTVKGEQKSTQESGLTAPTGEPPTLPRPDEVTQTTLFSIEARE